MKIARAHPLLSETNEIEGKFESEVAELHGEEAMGTRNLDGNVLAKWSPNVQSRILRYKSNGYFTFLLNMTEESDRYALDVAKGFTIIDWLL